MTPMQLEKVKAHLTEFAHEHRKDLTWLPKVKEQIGRAADSPDEYEELLTHYRKEAKI